MGYLLYFAKTVLGILLRHPLVGASVIAILPDGKMVLIQRRDTGAWSLPGGLVNAGESVVTAAQRELREETGLVINGITRLLGVYSSPDRDPRMYSVCIALVCAVEGAMATQDFQEVRTVRAFDQSEIPLDQLCHDHRQQLLDCWADVTVVR